MGIGTGASKIQIDIARSLGMISRLARFLLVDTGETVVPSACGIGSGQKLRRRCEVSDGASEEPAWRWSGSIRPGQVHPSSIGMPDYIPLPFPPGE